MKHKLLAVAIAAMMSAGYAQADTATDAGSSSVQVANVFDGAKIVANDSFAVSPFHAYMQLSMPKTALAALKSVAWSASIGSQSVFVPKATELATPLMLDKPGTYIIKAVLTPKDPSQAAVTLVQDVQVVPKESLAISGNTLVLPGTEVPLSVSTFDSDPDFLTVWEVLAPGAKAPIKSTTPQLTLKDTVAGKYLVSVGLYGPNETPGVDKPVRSATTTVFVATPVVGAAKITGPGRLYVGDSVQYKAHVRAPWKDGVTTPLKWVHKWVLPSGREVDGELGQDGSLVLNWTPTENDLSSTGKQVLSVKQYIDAGDGAQATAVLTSAELNLKKYIWPTFALTPKCDNAFVPMRCALAVAGATQDDVAAAAEKKISYSWSIPDGVTGGAKAKHGFFEIKALGTYKFDVTVQDDRGHSTVVSNTIKASEYAPYSVKLNLIPGLPFNRAPMTYGIKSVIAGGVKGDVIDAYTLIVDGQEVKLDDPTKVPKVLNLPVPGPHSVELQFATKGGNKGAGAAQVVVMENRPPICEPIGLLVDAKNKTITYSTKSCNDPDGKIKTLVWVVDGKNQTSTALKGTVGMNLDAGKTEVDLIVTDDSGESSTFSAIANY